MNLTSVHFHSSITNLESNICINFPILNFSFFSVNWSLLLKQKNCHIEGEFSFDGIDYFSVGDRCVGKQKGFAKSAPFWKDGGESPRYIQTLLEMATRLSSYVSLANNINHSYLYGEQFNVTSNVFEFENDELYEAYM